MTSRHIIDGYAHRQANETVRLDVALLPGQGAGHTGELCVIVDVLRASSSIVTILERGAAEVLPARDIDAARSLKERFPAHLLCGEQDGLPPEGFDYGNSPYEFSRLDLSGRSVILATSNGTRVLSAVAEEAGCVLIGALLNRTAAAQVALEMAVDRRLDVTVFCSAAHGGSTFVLEDALGAGAIADAASRASSELHLSDAARFARDAFRTNRDAIERAVASAYHARELVEQGLGDDVSYCARLDVSGVAPVLESGPNGEAVLRPRPPLHAR